MQRDFLYLMAVMDWATRKVLAWRVSNTMNVAFCVEALHEALARFGHPEIFNTDQDAAAQGSACLSTWNGSGGSRPHSTMDGHTPDEAYGINVAERLAA